MRLLGVARRPVPAAQAAITLGDEADLVFAGFAAFVDPPKASGAVIFHCRSGNRTTVNAQRLSATVPGAKVYVLDGGIEAWRDAGLPIFRDVKQPIEIMRQVQIVAGSLVAVGTALGVLVHPGFLAVPGFVGAGLAFAGVTGTCAMARILPLAPWNRPALTSASA